MKGISELFIDIWEYNIFELANIRPRTIVANQPDHTDGYSTGS